jgi:hypothetical protein
VSLGSSTIQFHHSIGSRCACACWEAGFSSQSGDRACVYYRRAAFCCAFFWTKGLMAKVIYKEMIFIYGGKCLSHKAVHNWVEKLPLYWQTFRWWRRIWNGGTDVAETIVKRLLCGGNLPGGKGRPALKADTLPTSVSRLFSKYGSLDVSIPYGPSWSATGITLLFIPYLVYW